MRNDNKKIVTRHGKMPGSRPKRKSATFRAVSRNSQKLRLDSSLHHHPGRTPGRVRGLGLSGYSGTGSDLFHREGRDFVFVGDVGRPDLLETAAGQTGTKEESAQTLFKSIKKFQNLPDYLQMWPGHGAGSACGKALGAVPQSTVGYEKKFNAAIGLASEESKFVKAILEARTWFGRWRPDDP